MPNSEAGYTQEQIEEWGQKLTEFAHQPKLVYTRKETVEALIEPITEALKTHSYKEVAETLRSWGFEITEGSLKQYVSRSSRSVKGKSAASKPSSRSVPKQSSSAKTPQKGSSRQSIDSSDINQQNQQMNGSVNSTEQSDIAPLPRLSKKIATAY